MACHYITPGHTQAIVGRIYSRYPVSSRYSTWSRYKLTSVNEATGACKLVPVHGSYTFYVSVAELSNWHIVGKAEG